MVLMGLTGVMAQGALKVRIGFNPTQNSDQLSQAAQAIADFIEDQLGGQVEVEVFLPTEYRGLVEAMRSGNLDFAFFPPDGYVIASREAGAKVLLKSVRFGNAYYWSAIIVRKDSGYNSIADLEGKTIAWVDPNSAAGYVFPRAALLAKGIDPDTFFGKQVFAGKHDAAVRQYSISRSTPPPSSPTTTRTNRAPGLSSSLPRKPPRFTPSSTPSRFPATPSRFPSSSANSTRS